MSATFWSQSVHHGTDTAQSVNSNFHYRSRIDAGLWKLQKEPEIVTKVLASMSMVLHEGFVCTDHNRKVSWKSLGMMFRCFYGTFR